MSIDNLIDSDYMRLSEEHIASCKAWQILPGANYKLSHKELSELLLEGASYTYDIKYAPMASFTVIFMGRFMNSDYDHILLFVKEIGRYFTIYSTTIVPTFNFIGLSSLDYVKKFRDAYEFLLECEQ